MEKKKPVELNILQRQRFAIHQNRAIRPLWWPGVRAKPHRREGKDRRPVISPQKWRWMAEGGIAAIWRAAPESGKAAAQPHGNMTPLARCVVIMEFGCVFKHLSAALVICA